MQFHSPFPMMLAAAVPSNTSPEGVPGLNAGVIVPIILIAIVATVAANWLTSFILARENATLGRAVLLPIIGFLAGMGFAVVIGIGAFALQLAQVSGGTLILAIIAAALGAIILAVYLPMRVYDIGVFRAIAFIFVSAIISGALSGSAQFVVLGPDAVKALVGADRSRIERLVELSRKLQGQPTPVPAFTKEALRQRQAELTQRYTQLEIRRKYLPANDGKAMADYAREKEAYEQDLAKLRADAAKLDAPKPESAQ